jgi:hypothetical protein
MKMDYAQKEEIIGSDPHSHVNPITHNIEMNGILECICECMILVFDIGYWIWILDIG